MFDDVDKIRINARLLSNGAAKRIVAAIAVVATASTVFLVEHEMHVNQAVQIENSDYTTSSLGLHIVPNHAPLSTTNDSYSVSGDANELYSP